ncbi:MAG: MATE family efflux transporter [Chloroflexi bacterium]|nr:MATE family efflux transporter [Chloroflexota bacterium]
MSEYQPVTTSEAFKAPEAAHLPSVEMHSAPLTGSVPRRVFNLAWPVISENFLETLLGIVDTWLVASLGVAAIAGVGAAIQFMFFVIAAMSAVSVGNSVLVAQAVGARNFVRAGQVAKQSLVWSVILSIPLIVIGLVAADQLVSIFGLEPAVAHIGAQYLRVTMGTVAVLTLLFLGGGVLRGAGDSRTPMMVTALANVLNVFLAYGLIYGKFGLPEMGAVGSAWATFIARTIALLLLLRALWRGSNGVSIRGEGSWWPQWGLARQVLSIGIPAAMEQVLINLAFLSFTIVISHLGTQVLAAQRIAMNAMSLSFLPGFGFAIAATALVGQSIGAHRPEEGKAVARIATIWAMVWMGTLGVLFFIFAGPIMRLYTDDPAVISAGVTSLRLVAAIQPFWGISFVQAGALRGTGDTQYPLRINTLGIWVAVGLGALIVWYINGSLAAAWSSFILTTPVTAFLMWRRFQKTITNAPPVAAVVATAA